MTLSELNIFPYYRQTFVSSHSQEEILEKIREFTKEGISYRESALSRHEFNGTVGENSFLISRIISQPNAFLPLITGNIEGTRTGSSILFIRCEMFYTTKVLLVLWSVMPLCIFILNLFFTSGYFYALLALFFGVFNYTITVANFHRQRRISMEVLSKILEK
ncbi:MAG: hypothetical protein EAZ08_11730 [Cytophagales bacterium]|nr:MAG: hypothetical protein EAZ08_11730 [Cytophagales bacterium]